MIKELLTNKPAKEKANIKALEIAKLNHKGKFLRRDVEIEIINLKAIKGGIEVLARAWKGGKQIGFGKDGSIDIERFRIYNPPILIRDDVGGDIERVVPANPERTLPDVIKKYREDPQEAILQSLSHTISLVGKDGSKIVPGKVGNTTSTFHPDADPESTSVDGFTNYTDTVWATARDATASELASSTALEEWIMADLETNIYTAARHFYLFDTSALGDTDTIDSATFSVYQAHAGEGDPAAGLIQTSPASNTDITTADHDALTLNSPAEGAARVTLSAVDVDTFQDFVLNATGLGWISKVGITKLGLRLDWDIDNTTPNARHYSRFSFADQAGTTEDPKLVVVHSAGVTFIPRIMMS